MRLTALCICGTLLVFSSLSWTSADSDEGDVLGDNAFRPCAATLRPEGLCRQGQDESTCPYLFSLPPLTLHLPKQLRELEKIVTDLQKLKDNVDQLRKMCADCTVSQTERECGRQKERGHEKLNEGTDRHKDERNWLNERNPKRSKDFSQECGTDSVKAEKTMEGDGDTDSEKRTILEEKGRKKWETERESDKVVVKENQREETLKVAKKDGKTKTEGAKQKDKLEQAKVPTAGGNEKIVDMVRKKVVEKNNRETETDRKKDNNGKGNSKGDPEDTLENGKERKITSNVKNKEKTEESDHHVWQDETKETEKNTQTEEDRGSGGIKMSEGHDEHTNQEREQHREERKKEMEKGIKVERNNEKPKQTESIGHAEKEKTIKEGEVEDRETGTEIKTEGEKTVQSVQRDSDGELASSKANERTDFVSISPTAQSIISLAPRQDAMDSNEVITFTSSLPSPFLSSSTLHLITDVNQGMTIVADGLPTQSTGFGAAVISEHPSPDAEEDFRATSSPTTTATINTLGGPGQQITSTTSRFTSTTSRVSSTTATTTTTTPRQNLYTTTSPGVADRSRWTAKKNISSNTKTGVKPLPGREPKPSEKHKPAIKPEADQRLKNPRNDRKPVRAPLPDKKTKLDQKSKPGKDPKRVRIPTPEQRPLPSHLPTDQNLKNNQIPKHDQEHTADQNQLPIQKPTSQKPQTVNPTGSDKDLQTGREPESVEIPITSQNSKLEKKLVHPLKSDKPEQPQKTHKELKSEEKTEPDQRSTINQYFPPVQKPEPERSETTSLPPTPNQKPITELMEYADENPLSVNDLTPEQEVTPGRPLIKPPDQKPKPSQKISQINQKPKPNQKHPDLTTEQKTKPHVKPKPDQTAQTNQGLITPQLDQMPDLNPKSVPDEIPEEESNKTSKLRPPPIRRPPTRPTVRPTVRPPTRPTVRPPTRPTVRPPTRHTVRPTVRPEATPVQRPKPAVQQKPSPKTKADVDPLQTSETKSEDVQNSQTDMPPVSSPGTQIAVVSHSPGDTEFSPRTERSETTSLPPTPNQKPITELMKYADENPLSVNDSTPEKEVTPGRPLLKPPDQKPKPSQKIPKINQKPKPNQKHPDLTTGQKTKPHVKPKPDQTAQTNQGLITPQPDQMPDLNPKSVPDKIPEAESNKTSKLRPPPIRRPPTRTPTRPTVRPPTWPTVRPTVRPGATPIQRPKPAVQQKPSPKTKADLDPLQINGTKSEDVQNYQTDMPPVSSPGTQIAKVSHSPGDTAFSPRTERSETTSLMPTPNQKHITELMEYADENPLSVNDSTPEQEVTPGRPLIKPPDQKPKPSQKIPKINQKPKPNQKHPDLTTGQKTKPHVKPKPDQTAQTNQGLITPQPDQMPDLNPKSVPDEIPEAESNKTSKLRPPPIRRPPTRSTVRPPTWPTVRPTVRPGATPVQMPKPAVQQKPSPMTKADVDPLQTSKTKSGDIQNSQTDMPPALSPGTQIAEVSHSPGDTEFSPITMQTITLGPKTSNSLETGPFPRLHTLSEGFTMSRNSRITSDLRPQTTSRPPSIPMTTSPQKNIRGILPSVIPSTSPGSDSRSQAKILHNVEETAPRQTPDPDKMMIPVPTPSAQTTSTNSPDLRSTTPATSGPEHLAAESSTPSARELRVKINQVAAFFNNSLSPNRRPPDRRTKEHPEDNQGDSRPDSKLPTLITSKGNTASDCSNHLLRGETKSGVYLVTPDLRSKSFPVFCDMELDGGGWTLLQRRQDGSVSFNRTWAEYRSGFGELDGGEFWLGNNMIHLLTRDRDMVLRVELEDFNGVMEYAEYEQFRVASERMRYRLTVGGYSGTAGDALRFSRSYDHNNRAFTTPDRDHDRYPSGNCGAYYSSGWWFDACMAANLNGRYYVGSYRGVRDGIFWGTWQNISNEYYPTNDRQSFKAVTMMIRPKGFTP